MGNPQQDTDELVRRAAAADPDATAQLWEQHRDRLGRMIALRLDERLAARLDASDIVQDVLTEAVARLPEYLAEKPLSFYPWLRRLAWQRMVEAYRQHIVAERRSVDREQRFAPPLPDRSTLMLAQLLVAEQSSPSQHVMQEQMKQHVRAALTQLKRHDRELLVLRYLEQLSLREIAEVLGSSEAAIKMRHMRALKRLGTLLSRINPDSR